MLSASKFSVKHMRTGNTLGDNVPTKTALDDFDRVGEVLNGLAVLGCVAVSCA